MISSVSVAGWIAHLAFVLLLALDLSNAFDLRRTAVFVVLWLAGFFGLRFIPYGEAFFVPYVACLDVAMAFRMMYGDTKLR